MPNHPRDSEGPSGDEGDVAEVPAGAVDDALSLLADRRRRYALYHLCDRAAATDREVTVSLRDLARHVAAVERDTGPERVLEDEFEHVYLGLQHNHVPRLADAGVVEYDEDDGEVRFEGVTGPLAECLGVTRSMEANVPDAPR